MIFESTRDQNWKIFKDYIMSSLHHVKDEKQHIDQMAENPK